MLSSDDSYCPRIPLSNTASTENAANTAAYVGAHTHSYWICAVQTRHVHCADAELLENSEDVQRYRQGE